MLSRRRATAEVVDEKTELSVLEAEEQTRCHAVANVRDRSRSEMVEMHVVNEAPSLLWWCCA